MAKINKHSDNKPRYFSVVVDDLKDADKADLEILGEEIIDFIIERTLSGKNVNNRTFSRYSKEYAEKEGKDNPPDLNLTSEMLDSLKVLDVKPRKKEVVIGYETGDRDLLGKVEGNIKGTYGKKAPIPGKARDFLGISMKDLIPIINGFK